MSEPLGEFMNRSLLCTRACFLYCTPGQHPEAWPASTYGHLRGGVSLKIVPANNLFQKGLQEKKYYFPRKGGGVQFPLVKWTGSVQ